MLKRKVEILTVLACLFFLFNLSGCISTNYKSTFVESKTNVSSAAKYRINSVNIVSKEPIMRYAYSGIYNKKDISSVACQSYPEFFTEGEEAVPLDVKIDITRKLSALSSLNFALVPLTLGVYGGIIPAQIVGTAHFDMRLAVSDDNTALNLASENEKFSIAEKIHLSVFSPLARLLPNRGDLTRGQLNPIGIKSYYRGILVDAIVKKIPSFDQGKIATIYSVRKAVNGVAENTLSPSDAEEVEPGKIDRITIDIEALKKRLPSSRNDMKDSVAVIIGNKNYEQNSKEIPDVDFAFNDAAAIRAYLTESLGFGDENIIYVQDATQADLVGIFGNTEGVRGRLHDWVRDASSDVFVYYSGHGAPSTEDGQGYLLPVDADPMKIELNGYSLGSLYESLSRLPSKKITVLLDSCFSGSTAKGALVKNASSIALRRVRADNAPARVTVLTASGVDEVASWDSESQMGLFTRCFIDGVCGDADRAPVGNSDGRVTLAEMKAHLESSVSYNARRKYGREQSPQVSGEGGQVFSVIEN